MLNKILEIPAPRLNALNLQTVQSEALVTHRWHQVFEPRIKASLKNAQHPLPELFPGTSPVLKKIEKFQSRKTSNSSINEQLYYHRFLEHGQSLQMSNCMVSEYILCTMSSLSGSSWPWQYVKCPSVKQFILQDYNEVNILQNKNNKQQLNMAKELFEDIWLSENSGSVVSKTHHLFANIHSAWSGTTAPDYGDNYLTFTNKIIWHKAKGREFVAALPLLFELEAYATYHSILMKMRPLISEFFGQYWLDVGTMPIKELRLTEECCPNRLFDEFTKLGDRRIIPLAINEYGCVADGNHRLTAAWIWNILSACQSQVWCLNNDEFQQAVSQYVINMSLSPTILRQTLHHLGYYLNQESYLNKLINIVKHKPQMRHIEELPVVPLMEYSTLAIVGSSHDQFKRIILFNPDIYKQISNNDKIILPAKACYHFVDEISLPLVCIP